MSNVQIGDWVRVIRGDKAGMICALVEEVVACFYAQLHFMNLMRTLGLRSQERNKTEDE